jgi:hypothetical protein
MININISIGLTFVLVGNTPLNFWCLQLKSGPLPFQTYEILLLMTANINKWFDSQAYDYAYGTGVLYTCMYTYILVYMYMLGCTNEGPALFRGLLSVQ